MKKTPINIPHSPTPDQETSINFGGEWDSELSVKMQEEVWWAPDILGSDSDWHNGYFIALIKKG